MNKMRKIFDTPLRLSDSRDIAEDQILSLYRKNKWSSAKKPIQLMNALRNAHSLITAYLDDTLVGLGYAISDGSLVVYYPHLLVDPEHQGKGIGTAIMSKFQEKYAAFHQQMITADKDAVAFYKSCGFRLAGETQSMWIYEGDDH